MAAFLLGLGLGIGVSVFTLNLAIKDLTRYLLNCDSHLTTREALLGYYAKVKGSKI